MNIKIKRNNTEKKLTILNKGKNIYATHIHSQSNQINNLIEKLPHDISLVSLVYDERISLSDD